MMVSVETYLRPLGARLRRLMLEPGVQWLGEFLRCWGSGFLLSAAALAHGMQPVAMGFCSALSGWRAPAAALGSMLGYRFFWGNAGLQGIVWAGLGCLTALLPKKFRHPRFSLLLPAAGAFAVSATGLIFRLFLSDGTSFGMYLLRVCMAAGSAALFAGEEQHRSFLRRWLCRGMWILALGQMAPVLWLNLGVIACAVAICSRTFPEAVLAGLALDLARITPVSITALACGTFFLRLIPFSRQWLRCTAPTVGAVILMALCGTWDLYLLPALMLGGCLSYFLPPPSARLRPRTETGSAQVQLELTAGVLSRLQQYLLESPLPPIDENALLDKARCLACHSCTLQHQCQEKTRLRPEHLIHPSGFVCRKPGRIQVQLQIHREQLYALRASRSRLGEYRGAMLQQYQFLAEYLRELADGLPHRPRSPLPRFRIRVSSRCSSRERANGDRCCAFPGTQFRYYVLLCDGMGTGPGAADNARSALELLRQLLEAGFPTGYALRSINSILALREQAGAVTLDLAEIRLDTGRAALYKWGAAPSWLLEKGQIRMLGKPGAPPGIRVEGCRESVLQLGLSRGETLVLLSDGIRSGDLWNPGSHPGDQSTGELAEQLLKKGCRKGEDDATVAVIRLEPLTIPP